MNNDDPDALRALLREWSATPPPDPELALRVQRDLAGSRSAPVFTWRLAVAALALGVLLGVTVPQLIDARRVDAHRAEMSASYLAWIAPHAANRASAR